MPVSFPSNPQVNDTFESNNKTWQWNGTAWVLVSVPQVVGNASITEAKLATGAVTADKIGSLAVTTGKIDSNAVTAGKIASSAVTETKVNDGAITQNKLASGLSGITVTTTALRSSVVPSPFTGQFIFLTDTSSLQRWDGSSWISAITTVPTQAPTSLALVSATTTTATISFTPGADGGSSIINYEYALSTNSGASFGSYTALSPADGSSPITITGLTEATAYQVKLKAVNALGTGASESSALSFSTILGSVEYLVIAGGGGGGWGAGGGGGAGGYRSSVVGESSGRNSSAENKMSVTIGNTYTVTVGGGGNGGTSATKDPSGGSNSVFGSITSNGGARGQSNGGTGQTGGGSGGGASSVHNLAGTAGTAGQGFDGGSTYWQNPIGTGGGGGAGANGGNGGAGTTGAGGTGISSSITGSAVTRAGGGGGGGATNAGNNSAGGIGGSGGGGTGTNNDTTPTAATANLGGGGAGGGYVTNGANGGNGGSGVVIIRYPSAAPLATSTTGSPTVATSGGYRVYTFTASGSITW